MIVAFLFILALGFVLGLLAASRLLTGEESNDEDRSRVEINAIRQETLDRLRQTARRAEQDEITSIRRRIRGDLKP